MRILALASVHFFIASIAAFSFSASSAASRWEYELNIVAADKVNQSLNESLSP